jgi:anti-anti-sigma regulatory factor
VVDTRGEETIMTPEAHSPDDGSSLTTLDIGARARVIVLRGNIRGDVVEALREELLAAIEGGVREIFVDLSDVESVGSPFHDLVSAASITLADRGGVLLVWSRKYTAGDPTYVVADIRDRALAELMPRERRSQALSRSRA